MKGWRSRSTREYLFHDLGRIVARQGRGRYQVAHGADEGQGGGNDDWSPVSNRASRKGTPSTEAAP